MKASSFILALWLIMLGGPQAHAQYRLEEAFPGLVFQQPVDLQHAGDGSGRIFVVEQAGRIRVISNSGASAELFLDITGRVSSGGEMGLLGLAFHPEFSRTGYFYVNYTRSNPRQTVIARFMVSANPDAADPESEKILLTIDQPYANHNGGQISFGPDGYLYIATGDGGSGGDPQNNAQNLRSLLGKILRIDVDTTLGELPYAIPADNPFAGNQNGLRAEIFAYGLRNPWRFSFDAAGRLWCADVGQNQWEEINLVHKGGNYGWRIMEGLHCYSPGSGCDTSGLELPLYEYGHDSEGGFSVTGGHVYSGPGVPGLTGRYIFADFASQRIWALQYDSTGVQQPVVTGLTTAPAGVAAFGIDEAHELYLCTFNGKIYRFAATTSSVGEVEAFPAELRLLQNYPNPFNPSTAITYHLAEPGRVSLRVYDLMGREIKILVDDFEQPGIHTVLFPAGDDRISSGSYYYTLRSNGVVTTRMMTLVR